MGVYLRANCEVSSLILRGFRQEGGWGGGNFTPSPTPPTSKQTPKKPTQIRVKPKIEGIETDSDYFIIHYHNFLK